MTGIYKISSIINPTKIYVGSAISFHKRKMEHLYALRKNKHYNKKLQRHFNKYGECDLVFSIIEQVVDKKDLLKREQFYIDSFYTYFNICPTAGSNLGRKFGPHSKEHRYKISKGNKGIKKPGTSEKLSIPVYKCNMAGDILSTYSSLAEARRKEGVRIKISNKKNKTICGFVWVSSAGPMPSFDDINKSLVGWRKEKMMPVLQIGKDGNIIKEFEGVRVAGRETGIDHRSIQSIASGSNPKRHTAGGFKWRYKR